MKIRALVPFSTGTITMEQYEIREVSDAVGAKLVAAKLVTEISGGGERFIVTLTPTAPDMSGTMDKTVAEINAAYEAWQQMVFRVIMSATEYMDVDCTARYYDGTTYPSFSGYVVSGNSLIYAYTSATDNGTRNDYEADIYTLTPAT